MFKRIDWHRSTRTPGSRLASAGMIAVTLFLVGAVVAWHVQSTALSHGAAGASVQAAAAPPGIASITLPLHPTSVPPNYGVPITRPGQVPAYTLADVRAYFLSHPLIAGDARPGTTITLTTLTFMPREHAESVLHVSLAGRVAPGAVVCFLEFSGTFRTTAISRPYTPNAPTPADVHNSHLMLDAVTGKAILWGFFPDNSVPTF